MNYTYIINELCEQRDNVDNSCLGKCHLSKEFQKQDNIPQEKTNLVQLEFIIIPHFYCNLSDFVDDSGLQKQFTNALDENTKNIFLKPQLPPPKLEIIA